MSNPKTEHQDIRGKSLDYCKSIQDPLVDELKQKYKLGLYGVQYCGQCGNQKLFKVRREHTSVEGYFECTKCVHQKWEYSTLWTSSTWT